MTSPTDGRHRSRLRVLMGLEFGHLLFLLLLLCCLVSSSTAAGPSAGQSEMRESKLEDVWRPLSNLWTNLRPIYQPDPPLSRESKNQGLQKDSSTTATPIGESLKSVTKQLLQSPSATDMIITDVRTPPKVKSQLKMNDEYETFVKGEAIPITFDDHDAYEIVAPQTNGHQSSSDTKSQPITPPSTVNGISTWILLSNSDGTTPSLSTTQKKTQKPTAPSFVTTTTNVNSNKKKQSTDKKPTTENIQSTTVETIKTVIDINGKIDKRNNSIISNKQNTTKNSSTTTTKEQDIRTPITINLQDSKFRNRQPIIMGRVPTTSTTITKNKTNDTNTNNNNNKKKNTTVLPLPTSEIKIESNTLAAIVPTRRRPIVHTSTTVIPISTTNTISEITFPSTTEPASSTKKVPVYHAVPTTSVIIQSESASGDPDEPEEITTESTIQTTKRPRRPVNKKKKKPNNNNNNKNRRRPGTKDTVEIEESSSTTVESKITEDGTNSTKSTSLTTTTHTGSRPLSTRIYNYLAREVMPSVGVGVVGLLLTAGLAGLFLYPFGGGVAARRTSYESTKNSLPSPDSHMYYYNEYSSKNDVDNAQNEETVFGQVLSSLNEAESQYEPSSTRHNTTTNNTNTNNNSNNKYRFDPSTSTNPGSGSSASIVYPSTKDAQKYSQPSIINNSGTSSSSGGTNNDQNPPSHLTSSRIQESSNAYSTLTDISSSVSNNHNDRNYPSLTTDTVIDDSETQYSSDGTQYSSSVSSSGYSSSGSGNKNAGSSMYSTGIGTASGNPQQYSSMSSNPQYSSSGIISSSGTIVSQNSNISPSYSSIISSPSVSLTNSNGSPQYQSLIGGTSSSNQQNQPGSSPQYSSLIGSSSSSNGQYSSIDSSNNGGHYNKGHHQYSSQLTDINTGTQYSTLTGLSVDDNANTKYPSLTTQSHHQNPKYQSPGEYAAYNNPSDIGTSGVIGYGSTGSSSISRLSDNHRTNDQDSTSSSSSSSSSGSVGSSSANTWKELDYGVGVVEKETIKEEDKSDKSQPQFAALHSSSQYMSIPPSRTDQSSFPSNVDMISITGTSNYSPSSSSSSSTNDRLRQGAITSIEHGPRYFQMTPLGRKRRQVIDVSSSTASSSPSINEIDGELPKDDINEKNTKLVVENLVKSSSAPVDTTTLSESMMETSTEILTTTLLDTTMMTSETIDNENSTDTIKNNNLTSSTNESLKDSEPTTQRPQQNEDFTFLGFVRRLAHFKLKLGLSFLRSTSQAVSKYFQTVQQRMEKVVRRLEKRARSYEQRQRNLKEKNKSSDRKKRDLKYYERKLKHKKSKHSKKSTQ